MVLWEWFAEWWGGLAGAATLFMKLAYQADMTGNPLLLLAVFSTMLGVQFFALGMLGELGARTYYRVQNYEAYAVRRTINFDTIDQKEGDIPDEGLAPRRAA